MKIVIESPTIAYLQDYTKEEISSIKKQLTYEDGKVLEQLKRHRRKTWWQQKDPYSFAQHEEILKDQLFECILKKDSNGYWIRPASIPYIKDIDFELVNKINYPSLNPIAWHSQPEFNPYGYQSDSTSKLLKIKHGNIALPTGCGKSFILVLLTREIGEGVVIVTPSKAIFKELYAEFQTRFGKHMVGGYGDGKKDIKKPITIAIGKSITMVKKNTEAYDFFKNKKALLVDESHTWGANTLENVCHGVLKDVPYRLFVSATQTRGDGTVKLLQSIIGKTVLEMSIEEAISKKYLCPLKFAVINTFSPSTINKRDPLECKREHFLYNENIAQTSAKIANASWNVKSESTLILVEELRQIEMLVKYLKVPFTYIHSSSKKEAEVYGLQKIDMQKEIERFNSGEVKVLIGTRAIATGTNLYPTHNTINWMGGSSEIITKQGAMGRSTRWIKEKYKPFHKEKTHTKIWDFEVEGISILKNQLKRRVRYYQENGETVRFI